MLCVYNLPFFRVTDHRKKCVLYRGENIEIKLIINSLKTKYKNSGVLLLDQNTNDFLLPSQLT